MRDRYFSPLVAGIFLPGLLFATHATPGEAENLYRVELLVFAYPAGGASEQWEALPRLAYPGTKRLLVAPHDSPAGPGPFLGTYSTAGSDADVAPEISPPSAAYVLLPAAERELGAGAASMRGGGRYRILFHEAWVQPLPVQSTAVPVVLDRSGSDGEWPELQGTITLYQAGNPVLETNLWLNTRGEYLPGAWRMPPPPRGPAPETPVQLDPDRHMQEASDPPGAAPADATSAYPYRHAVLLQRTQRMRNGELYYIDHPMLGVVAKITALEEAATAPPGRGDIPRQPGPAP